MSSSRSTDSSTRAAGVVIGGTHRGEDQLERFGALHVVVVAVRHLADADDDAGGGRGHAAEPPSSTTIEPDM